MYKPGDTLRDEFETQTTGGAQSDADALPTAALARNNVVDGAVTVTVANIGTGRYSLFCVIPGGYAAADVIHVRITATVGGTTQTASKWQGVLDGKRVADLNDAADAPTAAAIRAEIDTNSAKLDVTVGSRLATAGYTSPPSAGTVAAAVRDVANATPAAGSLGEAVNSAASAGDPWAMALPGAYVAGTAGNLIGNRLDAAISTRSTYAGADTAGTTTLLTRVPGTIQPQTGDAFVRVGAAGAGLTALGDARLANLDATVGSRLATAGYTTPPTANQVRDAVFQYVVDGATTFEQATRGQNAALMGKASGLATATAVYRDLADTKPRLTATVDADGNRTVVTRDLT